MKSITEIIGGAQGLLDINYDLQSCFEENLSDEDRAFLQMLRVIEEVQPPKIRVYAGVGRKPYEYLPFSRSIHAMRHYKIDRVTTLIQRLKGEPNMRVLVGFKEVPSEASFSRYFSALAQTDMMAEAIRLLAQKEYDGSYALHVSRDSTAIEARESVPKTKGKKEKQAKKRRGRPKTDEKREKPSENRIAKQITQTPEEAIKEFGKACAYGCKKNSAGNICFWKGYKLHLDITDTGFPVNAIVTAANIHDSQLAIPMEKMTEQRLPFCYSLMDAAYDAAAIDTFIRSRGRVPIIDPNKRNNKNRPPLDPAKKERYKFRSGVERANGYLKDNLLPAKIFVKGYAKVSLVILSAVVCLAALRTLQHFVV